MIAAWPFRPPSRPTLLLPIPYLVAVLVLLTLRSLWRNDVKFTPRGLLLGVAPCASLVYTLSRVLRPGLSPFDALSRATLVWAGAGAPTALLIAGGTTPLIRVVMDVCFSWVLFAGAALSLSIRGVGWFR